MIFCFFRDFAWHDLAFYNADLYDGLRRMMIDAKSGKTKEEFHAIYCCYFEVRKKEEIKSKKEPHLGGLEPPTFRLTAERANRLRHRCYLRGIALNTFFCRPRFLLTNWVFKTLKMFLKT